MITPARYKAMCLSIGPQKHVARLLGVSHFTLSRRWNGREKITGEAELAVMQLQRPGWQPIDTAPRDGTEILLWHPGQGKALAFWDSRQQWNYDGNPFVWYPPTHWHPLPPEPSTVGKDDWA